MIFPIVAYGDLLSNGLPLAIGMSRHRALTRPMRLFLLFVGINTITEMTSFILAEAGIHNFWVLHLYDLVAYTLLLYILMLLSPGVLIRGILRGVMAGFAIVWVIAKFTFEPFSASDQFIFSGIGSVISFVSLYILFTMTTREEVDHVRDYRFWIVGGVFLYFVGNLILFSVLQKFITLHPADANLVWNVHWSLNIAVNLMYGRGFWIGGR